MTTPQTTPELPELPEPSSTHYKECGLSLERMKMFTADQMREYAKTAVAAASPRVTAAPVEGAKMPYCSVKKLNQESYSIELEGMASAEVSVMSEDAQEMILAHIAEWMLAAPASPQPLAPPDTGNVGAIPEPSDDEVDLLLAEIDQIARSYDHHDYGLPTHDDDSVASMRAQVQWFFESWTRVPPPPPGGMVPLTEERLRSMKFHPDASHINPDYRDGFNHAIDSVIKESL